MADNNEQLEFIKKHKITPDELFDATGLTRTQYGTIMGQQGKILAFGVTPCDKFGHTLRTRKGHCVQCSPMVLAIMRRQVAIGFVYIAGSLTERIIKIGYTENKNGRQESINRTKYGKIADWVMLCTAECENAGKIEDEVNALLSKYLSTKKYDHDGHSQRTYELFTCGYLTAVKALKDVLAKNNLNESLIKEDKLRTPKYLFPNLVLRK